MMSECASVTTCKCIERIINALQFHEKCTSNDKVLQFFNKDNGYTNLLNDYSHILYSHLDATNDENNLQFELLYKQITKYIK